MIVHFYWCYFSYFLHPFSFTNSFCTNSSTKKISCTKPKPIVNRPSSGAGSPLQTSTNIINCTKHNPPPHHRKPNNKLCSWSPTCACVRAYFDWLSLFFFHHHNYYRAYRTTVQPPWSTHTTKQTPKKPRSQLFEQDIGPLKRSLSAKSRRLSRIADLALVTLKKHYFLFRMFPTLDLHTCVRPPLDFIFSHWKITKTSEIGYFLSLCFMFLACISASFVLFEFDSLTLQY